MSKKKDHSAFYYAELHRKEGYNQATKKIVKDLKTLKDWMLDPTTADFPYLNKLIEKWEKEEVK